MTDARRNDAEVMTRLAEARCAGTSARSYHATVADLIDTVFFDGDCALCHFMVRFCIARDQSGAAFRFAPLGGTTYHTTISDPDRKLDSIVVRTHDGRSLKKSEAVLHVMRRLGGPSGRFAAVASLFPRVCADFAYDVVARFRRRFGGPTDSCRSIPPHLTSRFLA